MIALILIMVFIIFGVYLFRVTGIGNETESVRMTSVQLGEQKRVSLIEKRQDGDFDVRLRSELSADGVRLAQQLATTLGTLVVAIAAFYFGSSSVTSAAAAAVRGTTVTRPTIGGIVPSAGKQNEEVLLTISGQNFRILRTVKLVRGSEEISGSNVMASRGRITANVKLDKVSGGENWDVIIENDDGTEERLEKGFKINPP